MVERGSTLVRYSDSFFACVTREFEVLIRGVHLEA